MLTSLADSPRAAAGHRRSPEGGLHHLPPPAAAPEAAADQAGRPRLDFVVLVRAWTD